MTDDVFNLRSGEYAKLVGISKEALRSKRRRGQLGGEYKKENGIYLWRRPGSNVGPRPGGQSSLVRSARSRGAHKEGKKTKYPNYAFQKANEIKMLARLKSNIDQETQDLLPDAIEIAKQKKRERLQKQLEPTTPKINYGGMIDPVKYAIDKQRKLQIKNYWEVKFEDAPKHGNRFFIMGKPYSDPFSTGQDDIEVIPAASSEEPHFKNKVDEAIYRAKEKDKKN